jgi:hypothetical protein
MHAVMRSYSGPGAKELFDAMEKRKPEVEEVMRSVAGFVSYQAIRTPEGGFTITTCTSKEGTDGSVKAAADWVRKNMSATPVSPPRIAEGSVILKVS